MRGSIFRPLVVLVCAALLLIAVGSLPAAAANPSPPAPSPARDATAAETSATSIFGGVWRWQNPKPDGESIFSISCPTTSTCFAAAGVGQVRITTDGGSTWSVHDSGADTVLLGISCPSTSFCVGVGLGGAAVRTNDGGATWTVGAMPAGSQLAARSLVGVSCYTTTNCFTVGDNGAAFYLTDGSIWTETPSDAQSPLNSITCLQSGSCYAAGNNGIFQVTTAGVQATGLAGVGAPPLDGVSCFTLPFANGSALGSKTRCAAVGRDGYWTTFAVTDSGMPAQQLLSGHTQTGSELDAVSCWSLEECVAAGADGSVYVEGPFNHWGEESTPDTGSLFGISCPGGGRCFVGGDYSAVFTTSDGGAGWVQQAPVPTSWNYGVACATSTLCFNVAADAAGNSVIQRSTDGGASWLPQAATADIVANPKFRAVTCADATTCFAAGGQAIIKTTDGGDHWSPQAAPAPGPSDILSIRCPTTTTCFALGPLSSTQADVIGTTDGGTTWKLIQTLTVAYQSSYGSNSLDCPGTGACFIAMYPDPIMATTDGGNTWQALSMTNTLGVSCPTTSACFAVGPGRIVATVDGGATWTQQTPSANQSYISVSCPSTTHCVAAGTIGLVSATADGGAHWAAQNSNATGQFNAVSCAGVALCIGVTHIGEIVGTTDFGATGWRIDSLPTGFVNLTAAACATPTLCFALAPATGRILRTGNGRTWMPSLTDQSTSPAAIACPGPTTCVAVGNAGAFVTTDGSTWTPHSTGISAVGVSCPSTSMCYAASASGYYSKSADGGMTWSPPAQFTKFTGSGPISCPTTTTCYAVAGRLIYVTKDGGASWLLSWDLASDPNGGSVQPFSSIACPDTNDCYASNVAGLIGITVNAGQTWVTDSTSLSSNLTGVSCPSPSTCYFSSTSSGLTKTTDFGATWETQYVGSGAIDFNAVGCVSTNACVTVGTNGTISYTATGGGGWARIQPIGTAARVQRITCPTVNDCYAATFDIFNQSGILVTHDGGTTWSLHQLSKLDSALAVGCTGANTCFAAGWPGAVYYTNDGGTTWGYQSTPVAGTDQTLLGISCPAAGTCFIVGTSGTILATTNSGASWQLQTSAISTSIVGISCPSSTDCVAVGRAGATETLSAGVWTAHPSGSTHNLNSVSCQGGRCFAAGNFGTMVVSTDDGATWTAEAPGVSAPLLDVSCVSGVRCAAVGSAGTMIVTADGTNWTSVPVPTIARLFGVALVSPGAAWIAGAGGTILANPNAINLCLTPAVTADRQSPQSSGTVINLTASSTGCTDPGYQFEMLAPGSQTWQVVQPFSANASFTWTTIGAAPGTYGFIVKARDANSPGLAGSATGTWDAYSTYSFTLTTQPCTGVIATSAPPGTAVAGTPVTITGSATGCPNPRFQFEMLAPGSQTWPVVQQYSPNAAFSWSTTGAAKGTYKFIVKTRDLSSPGLAGSSTGSWDVYTVVTYTLTTTACTSVTATTSPSGTTTSGTPVAITATASGCPNPRYQFEMLAPGSQTWQVVQPYATSNVFNWPTRGAASGTYRFIVKARDASSAGVAGSSTGAWDTYVLITYLLTSTPCTSVTATSSPNGTAAAGTPVTITGSASGCPSAQYQFEMQAPGSATWQVVQPYSSGTTFNWSTSAPKGTYRFIVKARDASSAGTTGTSNPNGSWDAYVLVTYTLT